MALPVLPVDVRRLTPPIPPEVSYLLDSENLPARKSPERDTPYPLKSNNSNISSGADLGLANIEEAASDVRISPSAIGMRLTAFILGARSPVRMNYCR